MASITDLSYTDNMADAKKPLLTDLRESLDAIETYINDSIKDNLVQVTNDAFGTAYAVDSDGAKNLTSDLYNKQTASDTYTGGDLEISTTGAWTDADASNCSVTFTPEMAGDFKLSCIFGVECVTTNATNEIDIRFRLTDGSTNSNPVPVHMVTGVDATTFTIPVHLMHEFSSLAASAQTVKLQYYITTQTATTVKILCNASDVFHIYGEKL